MYSAIVVVAVCLDMKYTYKVKPVCEKTARVTFQYLAAAAAASFQITGLIAFPAVSTL